MPVIASSQSYQLPKPPSALPKTQADWQNFVTVLQQWQSILQGAPWTAATLLNSWAAYTGSAGWNPPGFQITVDGIVRLRGLLNGNNASLPSTIFTLPRAPKYECRLLAQAYSSAPANVGAIVDVDTSGNVRLEGLFSGSLPSGNSGWLCLDGLSFSLAV